MRCRERLLNTEKEESWGEHGFAHCAAVQVNTTQSRAVQPLQLVWPRITSSEEALFSR